MHNTKDSVKEGYEVTDMNARLAIGVVIVVLITMVFGGVVGMLYYNQRAQVYAQEQSKVKSMVVVKDSQVFNDGPVLQSDPVADRVAVVGAAKAHLNSYGWIDDGDGVANRGHIPIEKAIELVANSDGALYRQSPTVATVNE